MVFFIVNVYLFPSLQVLFQGSLIVAQVTGFLLVTLPVSLYFIISDSRIFGQSFGKKKTGIQVIHKSGKALTIPRLVLRTILKFLPWELSHYLVYRLIYISDGGVPLTYYLIGGLIYALSFSSILTAIFTKKRQSLYDLLTGSVVIVVPGIKAGDSQKRVRHKE